MRLLLRLVEAITIVRGALRAVTQPPPGERDDEDIDPRRRELVATPRSERTVAALLVAGGVALATFGVLIALDADPRLLGAALDAGLVVLSAAAIVVGLRLVPQEVVVEQRPALGDERARAELAAELKRGGEGISRRRLLAGAAGVAGTGFAAATALPVTALGPSPEDLDASPWHAGVALVDEDGAPIDADALEVGSFVTAFPSGADRRELGSPVMLLRVDPATLALPAERRDWAPEGLLAYSKDLYACRLRRLAVSPPLYEPASGPPALVCPCHYSTFDVRRAARVTLGPAGRPLPSFRCASTRSAASSPRGPLSGTVGPTWWGTRRSGAPATATIRSRSSTSASRPPRDAQGAAVRVPRALVLPRRDGRSTRSSSSSRRGPSSRCSSSRAPRR
jgi:ubiquinol-cytochrome c reductase iron-sulfur subunit